jgi:tRNA G18 (ribose-2'-O)-methylase SpoU
MTSITLIAHNIRSTYNVGSIFRTAEGFGVKKIIFSGYTPYPALRDETRLPHEAEKITKQIQKTALGAESLITFEHIPDIKSWIADYSRPIIALEQTPDAKPIHKFTPPDEFALLLGEEVHGIEQELLELCDAAIEIPMVGQKESFNVSVATGIALYALTI